MRAKRKRLPKDLDPGIRKLVQAMNRYRGIVTIGSCDGHPDPKTGRLAKGSWYVIFNVERNRHGWSALEFLAWAINHTREHVLLFPDAAPPHLNPHKNVLHFIIEGHPGENPDKLAAWLEKARKKLFPAP